MAKIKVLPIWNESSTCLSTEPIQEFEYSSEEEFDDVIEILAGNTGDFVAALPIDSILELRDKLNLAIEEMK